MKLRALLVAALVVTVAACGSDDDTDQSAQTEAPNDETASTSPEGTASDGSPSSTAPSSTDAPASTAAAEDGDSPVAGGDLVFGMASFPGPIDPLAVSANSDMNVASAIFDTLVNVDEDGVVVPGLASSWESPDGGSTWVMELEEGVTFHDGTPFDAAAVVTHFDRLRDPANECRCAGNIAIVESVEATGPLEVTFSLSRPSASFISLLSEGMGMVAAAATTPENPIGTGPFTWSEFADGDHITVVKNPDYWQEGLPYLDSIEYRAVPDPATRLPALQSGDIHIYWEATYSRLDEIEADDALQLINYGGYGSYFVFLNMARPPFDNHDARLAFAKALDLETLHETINAGRVQPATSVFPRTSWAYPGEIEEYPTYDLEGAKALVEQLGGLSFQMVVPQLVYDQAVAVQGMLTEAGMDVELITGENLAMLTLMREKNFDAGYTGYSAGTDPYVFASGFHTDAARNYGSISDPELDELILQLDSELDQAARKETVAQIATIMAEQLPIAIINNYNQFFAATAKLHDVPVSGDGLMHPVAVWLEP